MPMGGTWRQSGSTAKASQSLKLREIGDELVRAGLVALDGQAKALGLSRSTTWTVLKGRHKASGLSAAIVSRILSSPRLPPTVRGKVLEYTDEKAAGLYGHSKVQIRRFSARIQIEEATLPIRATYAHMVVKRTDLPRAAELG
jgi:hypothetical protein